MKNQISGSISLDVSSLADAIAERLQSPSGLTALSREDAASALFPILDRAPGPQSYGVAVDVVVDLMRAGYVLAKLPDSTAPASGRDWFASPE